MFKDGDISTHPRMDVALDGNGDLLSCEGFFNRRAGWFGLIPFPVVDGNRMDVVCCVVIVIDLQLLVCSKTEHVRLIHASLLLHYNRLGWDIKTAAAKSVRNKHDHVGERPTTPGNKIFAEGWTRMGLCATRIGGHTNTSRLRQLTFELDSPSDHTYG